MTRLAFVAGAYEPQRCGVVDYTARLRRELTERSFETTVVTTYAAAETAEEPSVVGAVAGWGPGQLWPLARAVRGSGADLLHVQHAAGSYRFRRAIFLLPLLLRLTGWRKPIVTTVHEYGWWEWQPRGLPPALLERAKQWGQERGWWDREDGFLLSLSDAIITTNAGAEAAIHDRLPRLADRVHRIPIAANIEVAPIGRMDDRAVLRRRYAWPNDAPVVTFFGFLHPVKGLETLLRAFKDVAASEPRARLLLVGGVDSLALSGDAAARYSDRLQDAVAELGLSGRVALTGYLPADEASRMLAGADVGVLPFHDGVTHKSGSLLTLLGHGLPVVATRNAAEPDLGDGRLVRPVEPRDAEGLAEALVDLLRDPTGRAKLGAAGRTYANGFTWPSIAERHEEIYRTVLGRM